MAEHWTDNEQLMALRPHASCLGWDSRYKRQKSMTAKDSEMEAQRLRPALQCADQICVRCRWNNRFSLLDLVSEAVFQNK
jgi:hypothetical protein